MSIDRRGGPPLVRAHVCAKGAPTLPLSRKRSIEFAVSGSIARADIPRLCDALGALLANSTVELVVFDLGTVAQSDAVMVDALARLQLTARRLGYEVRLRHASPELRELIDFMGLRAPMCSEPAPRV